jgi:hypothetical protein
MANDITELRSVLFDTLRKVRDKSDPMDLDRARAVVEISQTIIDTAKVEVAAMRELGAGVGSGFLQIAAPEPPARQGGADDAQSHTATGTLTRQGNVTTHRLR